nr:hypothetical protein CFP56_79158 [Quercus suber]POF20602.1 hypothetical protein CFP56_79223 [Quercus suber]
MQTPHLHRGGVTAPPSARLAGKCDDMCSGGQPLACSWEKPVSLLTTHTCQPCQCPIGSACAGHLQHHAHFRDRLEMEMRTLQLAMSATWMTHWPEV